MSQQPQIVSDELDAIALDYNRKGIDAMRPSDLENWFTYHPPTGPEQISTYASLREKAKEFAYLFDRAVPDCADKTAAIRDLRNTIMAMNLAIACYQPPAADKTAATRDFRNTIMAMNLDQPPAK